MKKIIPNKIFLIILIILNISNTTPLKAYNDNDTKFNTLGEIPSDIKINLATINKDSDNIIKYKKRSRTNSEIFKYKSPKTKKIYAIKKTAYTKDETSINKDSSPKKEVLAYQRLKGLKGIPQFYYYENNNENKYEILIIEWVNGKKVYKDAISYDIFEKIYNLMYELDIRGVINYDIWKTNLLIDKKKEEVNIIDFDRANLINPIKSYKKSNIEPFEEMFLKDYLSYVYRDLGEEELFITYYKNQEFKMSFLEKKLSFFKKNNIETKVIFLKNEIQKIKEEIKNHDKNKKDIIQKIFNYNLNQLKTNISIFDFNGNQILNYIKTIKKIHPNNRIISSNTKIIKILEKIIKNNDFREILNNYNEIKELLINEEIYSKKEQNEDYYKNLVKFININIQFFEHLESKAYEDAKTILKENKYFFYEKRNLISYYNKLFNILNNTKIK